MKNFFFVLIVCIFLVSWQKKIILTENQSKYRISAVLDTVNLSLKCHMRVEWYNSSDSLISEIPFLLSLDSAQTLVQNVKVNGKVQKYTYAVKSTHNFEGFIIKLSEPAAAFKKIIIQVDFRTKQNDYFRERMLFYSEDFPILQQFENGIFKPFFQVHSDYEVDLTFPKEFTIASTGMIGHIDTVDHTVEVKTFAKSVPSFGFVLLKDIILKEDYSQGILIRSFYFKDDIKWGEKLLSHSKNIIKFYSDTLGFYPQPVLSIIPGYPEPYGGWPVCPNIVGIHRGIDKKQERAETHAHWVMSHEIGHQYWGFNYVLEPLNFPQWFGIGMGIHTDRLYAIKNIPSFNHSKFFSESYLQAIQKGYNTTIMQTTDSLKKQGFDWNNAILHNKSFWVLKMLGLEIGDNTFFEVFKYCLVEYKGVNVTLDMFKKDCESISGKNLDEFFHTWFFTNDHLEYHIDTVLTVLKKRQFNNEIKISKLGKASVSQVEIKIILDGNESLRVWLNGSSKTEVLTVLTKRPLKKIIIDPDFDLLLLNRKDWDKYY